jgi:hypothetical protein
MLPQTFIVAHQIPKFQKLKTEASLAQLDMHNQNNTMGNIRSGEPQDRDPSLAHQMTNDRVMRKGQSPQQARATEWNRKVARAPGHRLAMADLARDKRAKQGKPAAQGVPPPENYTYNPPGKKDPFGD